MSENKSWQDRLLQVIGKSFGRPHDPQSGPVWVQGCGSWLIDADGKRYLDFRCGYSAANFGHAPARLIAVAQQQLAKLTQLTQQPSVPMIELAEKLVGFFDLPAESKVLFNVTGARAVETAMKIALQHRSGTIACFQSGYHGRSLATQPLSDSSTKQSLPWEDIWGDRMVRFNYPTGRTLSRHPASWFGVLEEIQAYVAQYPRRLSAILIEPMLGARGYLSPPDIFFQRLAELIHSDGGLLIADEIQVGLGRGGGRAMSAEQSWKPDLMVLGKSLGGGLVPISAVVGSGRLIDLLPSGSESETFAGSPLAAAIAMEVIEYLKELEGTAASLGVRLRRRLSEVIVKRRVPAWVGGKGCSAFVEWSQAWPTESSAIGATFLQDVSASVAAIASSCLESGLLLHPSGPAGSRLVFLPPLNASESEVETATELFDSALGRLQSV